MTDRTTEIEETVVVVDDPRGFVVILPASLYHAGTLAGLDMRGYTPAQMIPTIPRFKDPHPTQGRQHPEPPRYPGARPARITRFRR